jgi:hypothetical protein
MCETAHDSTIVDCCFDNPVAVILEQRTPGRDSSGDGSETTLGEGSDLD